MRTLGYAALITMIGLGLSAASYADDTGYSAADVRSVYADACGAHGIDPPKCDCIVNGLLATHSVDAIMANGLGMVLRYDEAQALTDQVGEPAVWAASDSFDVLQNTNCSTSSLASVPDGGASGAADGAMSAAEAVSGVPR